MEKDQKNTLPYPAYGTDTNSGYPPVSTAYPPMASAYPPPSAEAYPPTTNAYPPQASSYPPPMAAPPPYSATAPPYEPAQTTQITNTTIVAISNTPSSYQNYSPEVGFMSKTVRLGFIRKVFTILSFQLVVTVGVICLFLFVPAVEKAGQNTILYIIAYLIFFVLYFVLVCCDSVRRNHPTNLILLGLFTLALSFLVGAISSYHKTNIVLVMMGVTAIVTICVCLFACQTKFDMTKFGGVLFVFALVVFFVLIFSPAFLLVTTAGKIAIGGVLALLFTAFMVYDVQLIMGGRKYELSEEEYVFGALILYVDIVNILLLLLYLFGGSSN
ncbi:protein lifeguard 2-like [Dendronephthya gigantea]|uniref:protein lifeguard 2-like n=1 Tax=Dendronephthya gigantea TaxID=151771 RepID=UPI00106ADA03|nr:protein lifeguard 2-like [Dendronephthya gigantea]